jgi:hypothetical protein
LILNESPGVKGVFSPAQIRLDPNTKIKIRTRSLVSEDLLNKIMDSLLVSLAVKLDCSDTFIL